MVDSFLPMPMRKLSGLMSCGRAAGQSSARQPAAMRRAKQRVQRWPRARMADSVNEVLGVQIFDARQQLIGEHEHSLERELAVAAGRRQEGSERAGERGATSVPA